jgi:hypothetical protein
LKKSRDAKRYIQMVGLPSAQQSLDYSLNKNSCFGGNVPICQMD